jgi:CubicO group peptidase (beta-lactamase class C family)
VAVRHGKNVVFAEAYGAASLSPLAPMTTKSVVDIGSTSKQFTASAILLLSERGQVDIQKPVRQYLPSLPQWAGTVTVDQMVHHTSGIPDYIELLVTSGVSLQAVATDEMALAALGKVTDLNFAPATSWEYSNSNYFLLGQIVLAVTGDDLGAFLAKEVFAPLGMDAVMDPVKTIPSKAKSYGRNGDLWCDSDHPQRVVEVGFGVLGADHRAEGREHEALCRRLKNRRGQPVRLRHHGVCRKWPPNPRALRWLGWLRHLLRRGPCCTGSSSGNVRGSRVHPHRPRVLDTGAGLLDLKTFDLRWRQRSITSRPATAEEVRRECRTR